MLKFMVVLVRKDGMDRLEFKRYFKDVHQPLARRIAGLRRYVQNFAVNDRIGSRRLGMRSSSCILTTGSGWKRLGQRRKERHQQRI